MDPHRVLSEIIVYTKFAKHLDDEERRETWPDQVILTDHADFQEEAWFRTVEK